MAFGLSRWGGLAGVRVGIRKVLVQGGAQICNKWFCNPALSLCWPVARGLMRRVGGD